MARRGRDLGGGGSSHLEGSTTVLRIKAASTVSVLLLHVQTTSALWFVVQRRKGRLQAEGLGRSTLATLALDHQWLATPSPRERLEGVEGACRAGG